MENVYGTGSVPWGPYASINDDSEDENVDFFVTLGDAYNDGQYQLMYQWAHIFNTKGLSTDTGPFDSGTAVDSNGYAIKGAAGTADLFALSLKVDGIGDEISDFLDETTVFSSEPSKVCPDFAL